MLSSRWLTLVAMAMVVAVAATGCKKKTRTGTGVDGDNIGGVTGAAGEGSGLPGHEYGAKEIRGQFQSVLFDYDSAQVKESERAKLDAVVDYMKKNTASGIIAEGHCDERGSAEYNLALGERRALAVRTYLTGLGCDAGRIQTKSFGKEKPVAMGHDEAAWSQNRRSEIVITQ